MRFISIFKLDFFQGFRSVWKLLLFEIVLCVFINLDFIQRTNLLLELNGGSRSLGDFALYMFGGMKEYIPSPYEPFKFPALWMLLFMLISCSTLWYPFHDLKGFGKTMLVACSNRKVWFLSKWVWCTSTVTVCFILVWIIMIISSLLSSSLFDSNISTFMADIFGLQKEDFNCTGIYPIGHMIFGPWLTVLSLSSLQLTLSIYINPLLGFCSTGIILIASTYYLSSCFIGNYGMLIRDTLFFYRGVRFENGVIINLIIIGCSLLAGIFLFSRQDILVKGELSEE